MSDQKYKVIELDSIKMEDGATELMSAPEMQPYLRYIEAAMLGGDVDPFLGEIAELPLEERYVWRVAVCAAPSQTSPDSVMHVPEGASRH
jgi:hypothetical protein